MTFDHLTRMPFRSVLVVGLFAFTVPAVAAEMWDSIPPNPGVDFVYVPPKAQQWQDVYNVLQKRQVLEELQRFVSPLRLPHPLQLRTDQCDMVNAFYNPSDRSLTLCYEWVADAIERAPTATNPDPLVTRQAAIMGNIIGVLLHEGGHMMFDMFDVPRFGREEDAADENAAFVALQFNRDVARTIVKGFAYSWKSRLGRSNFYDDEHGTPAQRLYNTLCLAYGGDPQTFGEFVDRGFLPKTRALGCADEYNQLKFAWAETIYPYVDEKLVDRVQQAQWLTSEELR